MTTKLDGDMAYTPTKVMTEEEYNWYYEQAGKLIEMGDKFSAERQLGVLSKKAAKILLDYLLASRKFFTEFADLNDRCLEDCIDLPKDKYSESITYGVAWRYKMQREIYTMRMALVFENNATGDKNYATIYNLALGYMEEGKNIIIDWLFLSRDIEALREELKKREKKKSEAKAGKKKKKKK